MKDIEIWKACFAGFLLPAAIRLAPLDETKHEVLTMIVCVWWEFNFLTKESMSRNHRESSSFQESRSLTVCKGMNGASTSSKPTRSLAVSHTVHMLPTVELTRSLRPKEQSKPTMFELFEMFAAKAFGRGRRFSCSGINSWESGGNWGNFGSSI